MCEVGTLYNVCMCMRRPTQRKRERETKVEFFLVHDIKTYGRIEI